jgi:Arc/MetJ-type ribon-helix-helix transcriptional regulator
MTTAMPPMASFSELLRSALRATLAGVTEGSRRNARSALDARAADTESAAFVLAALAPAASAPHRRSA